MGGWYLTEYRGNLAPIGPDEELGRPGNYSAFLWASSRRQAGRIARQRGLSERVIFVSHRKRPYRTASQLLSMRKRTPRHEKDVLHGLCFLGMIALASGTATIQDVLGDYGFIHEYCHRQFNRADLIERIRVVEQRVPGYLAGSKASAWA